MPTALIVGDSHVDWTPLVGELKKTLEERGYTPIFAGVGGTSAKAWRKDKVSTPNGSKKLDITSLPTNADLLIISLGTNDAANAAAAGKTGKAMASAMNSVIVDVTALRQRLNAKRTLWVGPPWMGNHKWYTNSNMEALYTAANHAGADIFDSRVSTKSDVIAGSGDGVHLGKKGAAKWANAISQAIDSPGGSMMFPVIAGILLAVIIFRRKN